MKSFKFTSKGHSIVVYPISTGTVAMKTRAHSIRRNNIALRLFDIVTDKNFTEELPVYCWLIEHPEGYFLIDTGYSSKINDPDYFKRGSAMERWFTSTQVRATVKKEEELIPQLASLGVRPDQLNTVLLTHLHVDHVGGIPDMKGAKFLVNETEFKNNSQAFLLPEWFDPIKIKLKDKAVKSFPLSYPVTAAADIHMVGTPGHTKGHCSVLLQTDDVDILFAGDVSYDLNQINENIIAAPNDKKPTLDSYKNIRHYRLQRPLIVLPSHDTKSLERLQRIFESPVAA